MSQSQQRQNHGTKMILGVCGMKDNSGNWMHVCRGRCALVLSRDWRGTDISFFFSFWNVISGVLFLSALIRCYMRACPRYSHCQQYMQHCTPQHTAGWMHDLFRRLSTSLCQTGRWKGGGDKSVFYSESATKAISRQGNQSCKQMTHKEKEQRARDEIWTQESQLSLY